MCYSPVLRQDRVTGQIWGRDGKAKREDLLEEGGGKEVRSIFWRRGRWIELGIVVPGPGGKGSLGGEGLSNWKPHFAVCCREEEAEL